MPTSIFFYKLGIFGYFALNPLFHLSVVSPDTFLVRRHPPTASLLFFLSSSVGFFLILLVIPSRQLSQVGFSQCKHLLVSFGRVLIHHSTRTARGRDRSIDRWRCRLRRRWRIQCAVMIALQHFAFIFHCVKNQPVMIMKTPDKTPHRKR